MITTIDIKYLRDYYKEKGYSNNRFAEIRLFSSTFGNIQTDNDIPNFWDGWQKTPTFELQKLGNSIQITTGIEQVINLPYSSNMRLLDSLDILKNAKEVILVGVEFVAFDVTDTAVSNTIQNQTVNSAIIASLSNTTGSDVITRASNTIPITWVNNFFRPNLIINGINVFDFLQKTGYGTGSNRGDLSMGQLLPYAHQPYMVLDSVKNIECSATVGQLVDVSGQTWLKKYPLQATLIFSYVS
jgi:hypothetical protein